MRSLEEIIKYADTWDRGVSEVNQRFFPDGDMPLHIYCGWGNDLEAVKILLENGADPNALGEDGFTPLHSAVRGRNPNIVKMLIDAGAIVTSKDNIFGQTPLEMARIALRYEKPHEIENIERIVALLKT